MKPGGITKGTMMISAKKKFTPCLFAIIIASVFFFFFHTFAVADTPSLKDTFQVICYHDVRDHVPPRDPDERAVSLSVLVAHFTWLKDNGYHPVSVDQLIAARNGTAELPGKAVLLTFDDGLRSVYTHVFPLLKLARYPAVVSLTGHWLSGEENLSVDYGHRTMGAQDFLTWSQIKEMADSGLVEFVSHSYHLHRGIPANPQGNMQPAATARQYNPAAGTYETVTAYKKRIRSDLIRNIRLIKKHLGKAPRIMAWPYGKYNHTVNRIARSLGMSIIMTLEPRPNLTCDLSLLGRHQVIGNPSPDRFAHMLGEHNPKAVPSRIVHVDIDYLYDPDNLQQEKNLDLLIERIDRMNVNVVYLQAFSDVDGDGSADALYFPNRHMPVRADLFNRVAWQLKTRSGVRVYAWMPVMSFHFPPEKKMPLVMERIKSGLQVPFYKRLSLFSPQVRTVILEIYEDLAGHADFDGLLFHDDAFWGDYEDAGKEALDYYREKWNLPGDIAAIRADPRLFKMWSQKKIEFLVDFTHQLKESVIKYRAPVLTARNIYARLLVQPESSTWFAQSYPVFLKNYDYTAVMAMPYMEKAEEPITWLNKLVEIATVTDPTLQNTVFELQAKDWHTKKNIPVEILLQQMELLRSKNVLHYGYYPDDFIIDHPPLEAMKKAMSR